jgi:hypothetical protein
MPYRTRLHNFSQGEVHPRVALDEMSVEGLAILELYKHRVPLGGVEKAEGELNANAELAWLSGLASPDGA